MLLPDGYYIQQQQGIWRLMLNGEFVSLWEDMTYNKHQGTFIKSSEYTGPPPY